MTTLAVGEQGFIPDAGGNEQRTLRQAAMAVGPGSGGIGTGTINPIAMTMADPEGGGGIGGIGNINTMALGEQGGSILNPNPGGGGGNFNQVTLAMGGGENNSSIGPVTMAVGEDGGGFNGIFTPVTSGGAETRALGETGGNIGKPNLTTLAAPTDGSAGPESGGMPPLYMPGGAPTTLAYPESGGGFNPPNNMMTQLVFENGRPGNPLNPSTMPGQNPFDFSTFKTDLLTGIGDLFKKYFDETSSPFGGNEITPPPAPGETKPTMSPGDLVAPSSNYGSLASKGMQSPFRGL